MVEYKTRDVSLAAFFRFRGYKLLGYRNVSDRNESDGHGEWVFEMSKEEAETLKVEYVNSDIAQFEGIRRGMTKQKYN
jgi:hypothetical protein